VFAAVASPCRLQADQVVGVKECVSEIGGHSVVRGGLAIVQRDRVFPLGSHIRDIENGGDLPFRSAESSLIQFEMCAVWADLFQLGEPAS
jgi:hypothetical protein